MYQIKGITEDVDVSVALEEPDTATPCDHLLYSFKTKTMEAFSINKTICLHCSGLFKRTHRKDNSHLSIFRRAGQIRATTMKHLQNLVNTPK